MKVIAKGRLRHCFFGDYSAVIALVFDSAGDRDAARSVLGADWQLGKGASLTWQGGRAALDALKAKLTVEIAPCGWKHCRDKCKNAAIDGLEHSIDFGPIFTLTLEAVDPRQMALL